MIGLVYPFNRVVLLFSWLGVWIWTKIQWFALHNVAVQKHQFSSTPCVLIETKLLTISPLPFFQNATD